MIVRLFLCATAIFQLVYGSRRGDGWMRPMEKDVNPNCWKCEPTPEERGECDQNLLTLGRSCGTLKSRFEERGYHCIVEVLRCHSRISSAYMAESGFIVARGRLIDSPSNNTSWRYFPLTSPAAKKEAIVPCTLDGIWQAVTLDGERIEVSDLQCITSGFQSMNHISTYMTELFRRR